MPGVAVEAPAAFRVVTDEFRANARTWANMFEARTLEPGIVSYEDVGHGVAFLPRETIARCMDTFVGKPLIYVRSKNGGGKHKKITPADLENEARGYITGWFEGTDGWFWTRGVVFDDEAKEAIGRLGLCSCGYNVRAAGPGGEYHALKYHERIDEFCGEHLAVVDRPRYEGATIRLNSKAKNTHMKLLFWKKSASRENATEAKPGAQPAAGAAPATTTEPAKPATEDPNARTNAAEEITGDTSFEIPTGEGDKTEKVTLAQLIEAHNARRNGADIDGDEEVDLGNGCKVKMNDLINAYNESKKAKTNATTEPAKPASEPAKPSHFKVLLNARQNGQAVAAGKGAPDSLEDRLARGNARYGTKPAKPASN